MESAIPAHLLKPRTRPARVNEHLAQASGVVPRFDETVGSVAVVYLGVQWRGEAHAQAADRALAWLVDSLAQSTAGHTDRAWWVDARGYRNEAVVVYALGDSLQHWWNTQGQAWTRGDDVAPGVGRFVEWLQPTVDRMEAIAEGAEWHGLTRLAGRVSGPVREQGYWGAMRDRLPVAQTDPLPPVQGFEWEVDGPWVRVTAPGNLCVIRTGQDWSAAGPSEQSAYVARVEPTMKAIAAYLDASGAAHGCWCHRYAWVMGRDGQTRPETFGMSVWRSLAHLERWAEVHANHLASYLSARRHADQFGAEARFSRYHEVIVPGDHQFWCEYLGCHPDTGLLTSRAQSLP